MPIDIRSRYNGVAVIEAPDAAGRARPTIGLRPQARPLRSGAPFRHRVAGPEGLEYLAWRYYGSSEAWWRIADANPLRFPLDLTPGEPLEIPGASDVGRVVRRRRF